MNRLKSMAGCGRFVIFGVSLSEIDGLIEAVGKIYTMSEVLLV